MFIPGTRVNPFLWEVVGIIVLTLTSSHQQCLLSVVLVHKLRGIRVVGRLYKLLLFVNDRLSCFVLFKALWGLELCGSWWLEFFTFGVEIDASLFALDAGGMFA